MDKNKKKYTVEFTVHESGAVSMDKIRYGASTWIARALRGVARSQGKQRTRKND